MKKFFSRALAVLAIGACALCLPVGAGAQGMGAETQVLDNMWSGFLETNSVYHFSLQKPDLDKLYFGTYIFNGTYPPRLLWESLSNPPDPAVLERIEQLKAKEEMRQVVAEETSDPEAWWEWVDSLPVESEIALSQKTALEWLEGYADLPKEQRAMINNNLLWIDVEHLKKPSPSRVIDALDRP